MVGVILFIGLIAMLLLGYYILYIRKRLVNRWNLEQVLEINRQIFAASLIQVPETEEALQREEDTLKAIPQRIVDEGFDAVNELLSIDRLGIAVYNETTHQLEYVSNSIENDLPSTGDNGTSTAEDELWKEVVQRCFEQHTQLSAPGFEALPLVVDAAGDSRCVGVLYLERQESVDQETAHLLLELIARYIAIVVFNAVVKLATKYRDIEAAHEEAHRASWEDGMLHVQNMVLDNCLSTIKHETIYYPNKIKQLIGKLRSGILSETEEKETVSAISELIEYYKGIFTILSSCASRQLEEVTFRRGIISVPELFALAEKYFRKANKGKGVAVSFSTRAIDERVVGDFIQLRFLLENLIDEALSVPLGGEIHLAATVDGEYIRFLFTDMRRTKTREELNQLFYPNLERMTATGEKGELRGTEYLVCKQIIRDHDEFAGKRGCRINAEPAENSGFTVYFTIPRRK